MNLSKNYQQSLDIALSFLNKSKSILFITGAGISAESGLPTYRGIGGLYEDKLTEENIPIEEALSGFMMHSNPALTWRYLSEIEKACRGASYNRAHEIIAEMEHYFHHLCVLTQNVDGFHRQAGSKNLIEIHGDLHDLYCPKCSFKIPNADYSKLAIPPKCRQCQHFMRPEVVLFGEFLDEDKIERLSRELQQGFDVIFSVGTSSLFPYISNPVIEAVRKGIPTIEINPQKTIISEQVTVKFSSGATQVLSDIWEKRNTC